jgi:hypothetical protein
MKAVPNLSNLNAGGPPNRDWADWLSEAFNVLNSDKGYGTTSERPINGINAGDKYFDTTLGIPIWYDGTNWIDATGSTV